MNRLLPPLCLLLVASGCYVTPEAVPPQSFTAAELIPARPIDPGNPLAAVIWTLNYDVRQFDTVWTWLHTDVPTGTARARAIGAAGLLAVAELDRLDLLDEGVAAFDEAIPGYPDDARLPLWRAYLVFVKARNSKDPARIQTALDGLRATSKDYPAFTLFGLTLATAGWEDAPKELIDEALKAYETVVADTTRLQSATDPLDQKRARRIMDTPIAPYNVPAMQAMIGDLQLRAGKKELAPVSYYTAIHANNAARWPWRAEVERRMKNVDAIATGLTARPATESSIGAQAVGSLGIGATPKSDPRFGGRVGNGSCSVCHTHVSTFDLGEKAEEVGWVKVKAAPVKGAPNLVPVAFLLPDGPNPIPAGFGLGPYVDAAAARDFDAKDAMFDGTMMIPAKPGSYFVAIQTDVGATKYQGYSAREFGKQWFVDVKAGKVADLADVPIALSPLK